MLFRPSRALVIRSVIPMQMTTGSMPRCSALSFLAARTQAPSNNANRRRCHHTKCTDRAVVSTSPQLPAEEPPLLMIEGDSFLVSNDGISRTLYKIHRIPDDDGRMVNAESSLMVEELFDLNASRKTFVLRGPSALPGAMSAARNTQLGREIVKFDLQEIDGQASGTGGTTWEASIVSALFFSLNRHLLSGDVIELGSGCGLGGILTQLASCVAEEGNVTPFCRGRNLSQMKSLTYTDYIDAVIAQCQKNIESVELDGLGHVPSHVSSLDWHEFASDSKSRQYDTVIGSDIIYLYPDVKPLAETIAKLLSRKEGGKVHLFSPLNRGALHELIRELKSGPEMNVIVECIEIERYRLNPRTHGQEQNCSYASKSIAKFLHVTACHKRCADTPEGGMQDID